MKNKNILMPIFLIIIVFYIVSTYSKFNNISKKDKEIEMMTIQKSSFTKDVDEILSLFSDELILFDYNVDDSIKTIKVEFFQCIDNEWNILSSSNSYLGENKETNARIGLKLSQEEYADIFGLKGNGYSISSFDSVVNFDYMKNIFQNSIQKVAIEPNKEIVLYTKYGYKNNTASVKKTDDFRNVKCDKGLAITVTFLTE